VRGLVIAECVTLEIPYVYDPSQQIVRVDGEVILTGIEGAHSLFVNEYEFGMVQKKTGMSEEDVVKKVEFLVVTRGEKGAIIYHGDDVFKKVLN